MEVNKRTILIDIDGTLYDNFMQDDHSIIKKMFGNNILIMLLDKTLWYINSFGIISNTMKILKFRLVIYAFISFNNPKSVINEYNVRYKNLLRLSIMKKKVLLRKLKQIYEIVFITNNIFAVSVLKKMKSYDVIYAENLRARKRLIKCSHLENKIDWIVGDNYTDDIHFSKKLDVKSIYVGNSKFKSKFKANYIAMNFAIAAEMLEYHS
ncbi:MAG: hypothetical protein RSB76_02590 [Clostridia bacterium]